MNAVIMGRKTWDSIPPRFRPLKGRLNIVISRSHQQEQSELPPTPDPAADAVRVGSLEQAIAYLRSGASAPTATTTATIARAFVIGGAQIYAAALALPEARRVLLTRVLDEFECDTFFPLALPEAGQQHDGDGGAHTGWVRRTKQDLDAWTGEAVPKGVQEENGTKYEFQMWERA